MTDNTQDSAAPVSASAAPNKKLWYVVHAYSGMEKSVQRALAELIAQYQPDEVMLTGMTHSHSARLNSFRIGAEAMRALGAVAADLAA